MGNKVGFVWHNYSEEVIYKRNFFILSKSCRFRRANPTNKRKTRKSEWNVLWVKRKWLSSKTFVKTSNKKNFFSRMREFLVLFKTSHCFAKALSFFIKNRVQPLKAFQYSRLEIREEPTRSLNRENWEKPPISVVWIPLLLSKFIFHF